LAVIFNELWFHESCSVDLKKKIMRILIKEIIVNLDDQAQELTFIIHWHGGCHTTFSMVKPMSGAVKYKTPEEDIDLIRKMAVRYGDEDIARVPSKLGRTTARGKRWNRTRVAYTRKLYGIAAVDRILGVGQVAPLSVANKVVVSKPVQDEPFDDPLSR
jgi:hypothetical protein